MKRVAILISGGGSNMVRLVEDMRAGGIAGEPVLVLSNKADAGGLAKAEAFGVPTTVIDHKGFPDRAAFDAAVSDALDAVKPDLICLAGFMRILTPAFTARWGDRMLNIHPSLLPLFKGLHTHRQALSAGVAVHGCTVHKVTADLDDGPILGQAVVPVLNDDTEATLAARVLTQEHLLYPAVVRKICADEPGQIALSAV
ncbi:phosphoribosylglycinamide formyltransferase [Pontivivens insulae]|uniref:Phosphoribosylglycinamide formyltransferase n=1 Tax=Pontivivens insulae TaxID=1639689 RepID=A0A2R8ABH4_9RHOB|nr:phosphoribosylglycinamide formyltransferase [Pontivivens insulae]RED11254.1 formyltetrahydrofolate-dependent phosphoribosylglycinamide formyltransferase [Pontivivens insulae]SPF29573.1 Phosphoribosylglycinamide formyltransferase [Pontivivens insulae]